MIRKLDAGTIFLSYRRDDASVRTQLIYKGLAEHFGADRVFMDIEDIPYGENFKIEIDRKVGSCSALLAIIGPRWASLAGEDGLRRLDREDDFVRLEIATALRRRIRVIPVLLEGARMPAEGELPAPLAALSSRNALEIEDRRFKQDMESLIGAIAGGTLSRLLRQAAARLRLGRLAWWIVPSAALTMFFAALLAVADVLTLDTKIETYTMAVGNLFRRSLVSERLALVVIDKQTEKHFGKALDKSWRHEHARLIGVLSRAGADVVAFDLFMNERSDYDGELIAAIRSAAGEGTAVLLGTQDGSSSITGVGGAMPAPGLLCAGTRLGYATLVPLSVRGKNHLAALALLAAYPGAVVEEIDEGSQQVLVRTASGLRRIGYSQLETLRRKPKHCPALAHGDVVAQMIVEFRALRELRDPIRRHRYEDVAGAAGTLAPERLKGKIVLVGYETDRDMVAVPRGLWVEQRYGFEVHADALNTLLRGTQIRMLNLFGQFLVMLGMGALGGVPSLAGSLSTPLRRRAYLAEVLAAYVAISLLIYVELEILLNAPYHIGAFVIAYWALGKAARKLKAWDR